MRLLLLEDDGRLGPLVAGGLRTEGHAVDHATTIEDARWLATENRYDVLVLDVMIPEGDGFELCRELRAAGNWTPCVMLTARDAIPDRVRGLDVGADDYLVKPFAFDELLARLRALQRRGAPPRPAVLTVDTLAVDPASREAWVDGALVPLSTREFALLELFARHPGEVLDRTTILERVWDWAFESASNVVDVHVHSLRTKLGLHQDAPTIETVRGAGYVLRSRLRA